MRRVIDDTMYGPISQRISNVIWSLNPKQLSKYDYGCDRVQVSMVRDAIVSRVPKIRLGKNEHAHGIGNNNAYEIIYTGNPAEEQICGALHLTNDMFGGVYAWVSDVDGGRKTETRHLR